MHVSSSARLEVVALPLPPHLRNRLLATGFGTVADLERAGGPMGLARGERGPGERVSLCVLPFAPAHTAAVLRCTKTVVPVVLQYLSCVGLCFECVALCGRDGSVTR